MNDTDIISLYFQRDEKAISESEKKHGRYCRAIARNILGNKQDCEECLNDVYLKAWNSIPPHSPKNLSAYLGKITRNTALKIYEKRTAEKRAGDEVAAALDELTNVLPACDSTENSAEKLDFSRVLNDFLSELPREARIIFIKRYWLIYPVKEIAKELGVGESKVKMSLMRTREKLKTVLEKEGFDI